MRAAPFRARVPRSSTGLRRRARRGRISLSPSYPLLVAAFGPGTAESNGPLCVRARARLRPDEAHPLVHPLERRGSGLTGLVGAAGEQRAELGLVGAEL